MNVVDYIQINGGNHYRTIPMHRRKNIGVHRISLAGIHGHGIWDDITPIPDEKLTGPTLYGHYQIARTGTDRDGNKVQTLGAILGGCPYPFLIPTDGRIHQVLPASARTPHAWKRNTDTIAVAIAGNFTIRPPTEAQMETLIPFLALWSATGLGVYGHTEMRDATKWVNHECPGRFLPMAEVRAKVKAHKWASIEKSKALDTLEQIGVTF